MDSQIDRFIEFSDWKGTREEAQQRIEAANGNLELALALLFEEGPGVGDVSSTQTSSAQTGAANSATATTSLMEELSAEYSKDLVKDVAPRVSPYAMIYELALPGPLALFKVLDWVVGIFSGLINSYIWSQSPRPTDEAINLAFYKEVVKPLARDTKNLQRGITYVNVLEKIKRNFKNLLIVVTSKSHETPPSEFIRRVLSLKLAKREDTYLWFTDASSVEGLKIASAFGVNTLPYAALIAPSQKTAQSSVIVMAKLLEITNSDFAGRDGGVAALDRAAERAIDDHSPKIMALRLDRERFDVDRQIREEQDDAYKRSLEKDKQRAREAQEKKVKEELAKASYAAWCTKIAKRRAELETIPKDTAKARIGLRMPDGTRLNLTLPGENPVSDIYDAAFLHLNPDLPTTDGSGNEEQHLLENYVPDYGFTLISSVTKGALQSDSTPIRSIESAWPSGTFMVDIE